MSWQLFLNLVAPTVGLGSGGWLCYPTAQANPHALAWIANPPWKSADGMAELAIEQSAQYWVGGGLLALAFLVQVAAALAPTSGFMNSLGGWRLWLGAAVVLAVVGSVVYVASKAAYRWRKTRLRTAMANAAALLAAHPRVTPLP